jgi:hypothetical protein
MQLQFIGFYNRCRECLLRGTNWVFKWDKYRFVLKELIQVCSSIQFQLDAQITEFISIWQLLYMFRASLSPIFRSTIQL